MNDTKDVALRLVRELQDGTASMDLEAWAREASITLQRLAEPPQLRPCDLWDERGLEGFRQAVDALAHMPRTASDVLVAIRWNKSPTPAEAKRAGRWLRAMGLQPRKTCGEWRFDCGRA